MGGGRGQHSGDSSLSTLSEVLRGPGVQLGVICRQLGGQHRLEGPSLEWRGGINAAAMSVHCGTCWAVSEGKRGPQLGALADQTGLGGEFVRRQKWGNRPGW